MDFRDLERVHYLKLLSLLFIILPNTLAICYYPDGTVTNSDVPCLSGSEASWCCGFGYACLDNKICMATVETPNATEFVRGSCTDETWRDANCPNFCVNGDKPAQDLLSGGEGMAKCSNTDMQMYYCIDFNQDAVDCAKTSNIAVQATGTASVLTTIGFGSSTASTTSTATSSGSPVYESTSLSSNTGSTSSLLSTTSPASVTPSATSSPTASISTPSSSIPTPPPQASSTPSTATTVGASVGASVGVLLVSLILLFLVRRYRQKKKARLHQTNVHGLPYPSNTTQNPPEYGSTEFKTQGHGLGTSGGELSGSEAAAEMETERVAYELFAGTPRFDQRRF